MQEDLDYIAKAYSILMMSQIQNADTRASLSTIIGNQIEIMAILKDKPIDEISNEVTMKFRLNQESFLALASDEFSTINKELSDVFLDRLEKMRTQNS